MKRLTKRLEDGQAVMDCTGCPESWNTNPVGKCTALYCRNMLKDRLAAIEYILEDDYELDKVAELVKADRDGKVPKYTIGDVVYDKFGNRWEVEVVELHSLHTKNEWLYRCVGKDKKDFSGLWEFEVYLNNEASNYL